MLPIQFHHQGTRCSDHVTCGVAITRACLSHTKNTTPPPTVTLRYLAVLPGQSAIAGFFLVQPSFAAASPFPPSAAPWNAWHHGGGHQDSGSGNFQEVEGERNFLSCARAGFRVYRDVRVMHHKAYSWDAAIAAARVSGRAKRAMSNGTRGL